jgi:hypothetical protein
MEQTTMLAIIAIALALGLMTGVLVVAPNTAYALPKQANNRERACDHAGEDHINFC